MDLNNFASTIARPDLEIAGGCVAAHVGSFGSALGEMVAALSEGRPAFAGQDSRFREIHRELTDARNALQNLAAEDSLAFASVITARKMPRNTSVEREARAAAVEFAMKTATEIPLRNARTAFRVLELLRIIVEIGNPNALTDAAIGAQLAYASLKSAQYSVLTNAPEIADRAFVERCRGEAGTLAQRAQEIIRQIDLMMEGSCIHT